MTFEITREGGVEHAFSPVMSVTVMDGTCKHRVANKIKFGDGKQRKLIAEISHLREIAEKEPAKFTEEKASRVDDLIIQLQAEMDKAQDNVQVSRWLVCELDGVKLYVQGENMIMTRDDLWP